ncbi:MAG: flagellar filament outer layer protein FlaA [Spirochaetes bacterium]|nr:flagellar filament outer layer protein FlaA [Spirochaetota bacterium]
MRRQLYFIAIALMVVIVGAAFADEAVLIDFATLKADILPDTATPPKMSQNKATMMDFAALAGQSYTDEQKIQMRSSLAIENWEVLLASSARTNTAQTLSYTREATIADSGAYFKGKSVLGIRVHFPTESYNSWARILPPFDIPAFEPKATIDETGAITVTKDQQGTDPENARLSRFEGSYDPATKLTSAFGVVKNVGAIKRVAVWVRGMNHPHGLYVILVDSDNNEHLCFVGYLNFDGWRELSWENPQYVRDVKNRELRLNPLYPNVLPFVRFGGFQITRDAAHNGGDFVAYFKEVRILYDKASLEPVRDIDDEALWGIVTKREDERKKMAAKYFGQEQVLRYVESLKQETSDDFTAPPDSPPKTK